MGSILFSDYSLQIRLMHSFFFPMTLATAVDAVLILFGKDYLLNSIAQFFCQLVNWFMFFCITRTLSNSLETVLTMMGLYYWLSASCSLEDFSTASRKLALFIAALACAIRPTSAITWLYVGMLDLVRLQSRLGFLFLEVIPIG